MSRGHRLYWICGIVFAALLVYGAFFLDSFWPQSHFNREYSGRYVQGTLQETTLDGKACSEFLLDETGLQYRANILVPPGTKVVDWVQGNKVTYTLEDIKQADGVRLIHKKRRKDDAIVAKKIWLYFAPEPSAVPE
nr:hypothetical protein [bacterium]